MEPHLSARYSGSERRPLDRGGVDPPACGPAERNVPPVEEPTERPLHSVRQGGKSGSGDTEADL